MNIESNLSGHWTDEQLIEHLYGVGSEETHIAECSWCRNRLDAMVAQRRIYDAKTAALDEAGLQRLAAQRRSIYSRVTEGPRLTAGLHIRRWAAAVAMVVVLGGGAFLFEQNRGKQLSQNRVTDAQLAQQVSQIANDSEPSPTAPLQQLFDE